MVSGVLGGRAKYTPSDILTCWMASPDGVLPVHSPRLADMFSTRKMYTDIGPVRPALTSFALQTVGKFVAQRAEQAVQVSSGLHASVTSNRAEKVIIHALADLLFCRSQHANLFQLARGILYFGSSVPVEIMAYNCRIGNMPSYSTIHRSLQGLSAEEGRITSAHGCDPTTAGILLFDNIQNLAVRENHMNVGMSGLWVEAWDTIDVNVFDLNDKWECIANGERASLTVDRLFGFLDQEDSDTTGYLQWLEVLMAEVKARYRATAKLVIPLGKSVVHPLAPSGKKKTIPSELKDGLLDFLGQLQAYLQFHKDAFKSFEILEPQLQTHWGRISGKSTNPSSLGHSAAKIGHAAPSNMKKVEFYPGSQLLYLARLPDLEDLVEMAKKLHCTYSTARARDHAIFDTGMASLWDKTIPKGSQWVPIEIEDSSLDKTPKKRKSSTKKKPKAPKEKTAPVPFKGDFVLAQAIDFLCDALNSRKTATAVAEGDVGRLYECIKYMLFTFSGSTHTNYMAYLLETICNLELESSPGLREALLLCLLINLTGLLGHFEEGDYVVEFFNRLLEDIVQHKNAQFDNNFIQNVVSRNLRHIAELKLAWCTGTGMAKKSHTHTDPHANPEMRILLKLYRTEELHSRRLGRQIDDRDTDDFAKGVKKLRNGGLKKFIQKSLRTRQTTRTATNIPMLTTTNTTDKDGSDDGDKTRRLL
ncbi:hypothetical protein B0H10DRAFT_1938439 [Mycena sp. CBHHK59/15]|nr:hypothetical protein B0H10DRAFT_1938439 [Mycena sp. CBHHK59/15]